jgi:hypothetical protein
MALELVWPYVKTHSNLSVHNYLAWAKKQEDPIYQLKFEQVLFNYYYIYLNFQKRKINLFIL